MTPLFPEIEPTRSFRLRVSELHDLHVEESGNPSGRPVVFLHGGPGAGVSPIHRRFFDPSYWRVILFDQRGSGKSTPLGELRENTTWDLVEDIERIRTHLDIPKWLVFGGSWGSTLGLAYAEKHPDRVTGLVLRGIFLARKWELEWSFTDGLRRIWPDAWEAFVAPLTMRERGSVVRAYHRRLTSEDAAERTAAALAWNAFEGIASRLLPDTKAPDPEELPREIALARIEAHYFINDTFLESDDQILRDAWRLRGIPGVIVQGRYDLVCPMQSAWDLAAAWPEARLVVVPAAGHAADEPAVSSALVEATEALKKA